MHPELNRMVCDGFMCDEHHKCIARLNYELNKHREKQIRRAYIAALEMEVMTERFDHKLEGYPDPNDPDMIIPVGPDRAKSIKNAEDTFYQMLRKYNIKSPELKEARELINNKYGKHADIVRAYQEIPDEYKKGYLFEELCQTT